MGSKLWWVWLLLALAVINYLASDFHLRFDLTKEKRYTLGKATKDLLAALDENVEIDVFLKGEFPSGFRKLSNTANDFLRLLKESSAKINYKFISPEENMPGTGSTYGDTLIGKGALPINLTVQKQAGQSSNIIFPVALMRYKDKESLIHLYNGASRSISQQEINSAEALMEYQFTSALNGLVHTEKPIVAYSIGNGEPTDARTMGLQEALQDDYQLFTFNINAQPAIPDTFKALLIVKPSLAFSEEEKLKIDQYIMRGGKLMLYVDNLIAEQDSLRYGNTSQTIAYDRNLNLTDLLFRYGARVNPSLIMDLQCDFLPFVVGGTQENPQFDFLHWNYYPLFEPKGNHLITKNLGLVASKFVNSIDTIAATGIEKTVLLSSSPNSRVISTPALISLNENKNTPQDAKFNQQDIPAAILLEGKFTSLYKNRVAANVRDSLQAMGLPFRGEAPETTKIIIAGDGDMALNDVSAKNGPLPLGVNLFTLGSPYEYTFANKQFLINSLEYLVNNPAIIETRNKDIVLRLLNTSRVNESKATWQFINVALPVLLIIISGGVYQAIRRRKYSS